MDCPADYDPTTAKKFKFDVLLGQPKIHRDWLFEKLSQHNLIDNNIVTYRYIPEFDDQYKSRAQYFTSKAYDPELDPSFTDSSLQTAVTVPWYIFNETNYSIVAESVGLSRQPNIFISEKTWKPIYAKRLFVLFAKSGSLASLKSMGFQTFGDIIDESYDDVIADEIRWQKAFDQILLLAQLDDTEVKRRIAERCEYNHNLIKQMIPAQITAIQDAVVKYLPQVVIPEPQVISEPQILPEPKQPKSITVLPADLQNRKRMFAEWKSSRG
jgi:hypothetical protein